MSQKTELLGIKPKFREKALVAVVRNALGMAVYIRREKDKPETFGEPIVLMFADASDAVRAEALGYGFEVRLTRAAAIEHAKSGRAATAQERHEAISRVAMHYASGAVDWTLPGGGGGGLSAETQDLIEALTMALDMERDIAEAQVRTFTSAQRAALRIDPEIKAALEIVWERKGAGVDTQSLKDSLKSLKV